MHPFHNCIEKRDLISYNIDGRKRKLLEIISLIASDFGKHSAINEKLQDLWLHHVKPVLHFFVHKEVIPIFYICAIFRFEPVHVLSLGTLRLLKECPFNYLFVCSRTISSICCASRDAKAYNQPRPDL